MAFPRRFYFCCGNDAPVPRIDKPLFSPIRQDLTTIAKARPGA
jgi:hypothetical protein